MKSTLRKLIPSIIMVLIAATMAGTSTFAWFSMNNKVTITGMQVTTKVSSNLLITEDTLESEAKKADNLFTNTIHQVVTGLLEPVSTEDGVNFFYTTDAKADGSKDHNVNSSGYAYEQYVENEVPNGTNSSAYYDRFSEAYGIEKTSRAVPYVDYVFQLKANNTGDTPQYLNVTALNLRYNGDGDETTAFRVAFFVQDITTAAVSSSATGRTGTYTVTSSANFNDKVVNSTAGYAGINYITTADSLATVTANSTKYYKVVVRMWLEGQDTTCKNDTFMALTEEWELGIAIELQSTENVGVTNVSKIGSSGNLITGA